MPAILSLLSKAILTLLTLYISSCVYALFHNILLARRTGFPLIVTPVNQDAIPWVRMLYIYLSVLA